MKPTEQAVSRFLTAIGAPSYDLGVLTDRGMQPCYGLSNSDVFTRIGWLAWQNARGAHIFVRPTSGNSVSLIDDLSVESSIRLECEGFEPAAIVETSPGNHQAWLKHRRTLTNELATFAARKLARRFDGDQGAADWRHFGRLPGFTNRKPKHQRSNGQFPYVLLRAHAGTVFSQAEEFCSELESLLKKTSEQAVRREERHRTLSPLQGARFSHLSLPRFRELPAYAGSPASADAAFCVAASAAGMPEAEIREHLTKYYLSRDPSLRRRDAYVNRTLLRMCVRAGRGA